MSKHKPCPVGASPSHRWVRPEGRALWNAPPEGRPHAGGPAAGRPHKVSRRGDEPPQVQVDRSVKATPEVQVDR